MSLTEEQKQISADLICETVLLFADDVFLFIKGFYWIVMGVARYRMGSLRFVVKTFNFKMSRCPENYLTL